MMNGLITALYGKEINELRGFIHQANAVRASQVLIDLCNQQPLIGGVLTLLRNGSINEAIDAVAVFDQSMAAELRDHMTTLVAISVELNRQPKESFNVHEITQWQPERSSQPCHYWQRYLGPGGLRHRDVNACGYSASVSDEGLP